jgi:hypothetical protein
MGAARCGLGRADLGARWTLPDVACTLACDYRSNYYPPASTEPGRREAGLPSPYTMPSCALRDILPGPPAHRRDACVSQHSPRHGRLRRPWA